MNLSFQVKVISSTPFPESSVGDVSAPVEDVRVVCSMEPTKAQGKIQFEFSTSDVDAEEICRTFVSSFPFPHCFCSFRVVSGYHFLLRYFVKFTQQSYSSSYFLMKVD